MTKSVLWSQKVLNVLRNIDATGYTTVWLSLNTGDPLTTGADEVVAAEYARKQITFSAPAGDLMLNDNTLIYAVATSAWGTITHCGFHDAETAGNFLVGGAFAGATPIIADQVPVVDAASVTYQDN